MIFDYGFSLVGKAHIARGTCCQDNHKIKKLDNGWCIAAVADGVGSAENSQIGSRIATETVVSVCEEYMPWDYNTISIKSMMRTAYNYAYKKILMEAEKSGNSVESYDTTLSMVIYDGHRIIYGHSGDGAIIGLNTFGDYVEITKPQKGVDGVTVIPLRAGYTQWKIDTYDEELASVILVTDGMLDIFCPYLLKNLGNEINNIYVPLVSFFADPIGVKKKNFSMFKRNIEKFLLADNDIGISRFYERLDEIYKARISNDFKDVLKLIKQLNYPIELMNSVQDDKTVVGLINTNILVDNKDVTFFAEPDWERLRDTWNRKAYPHLYEDETKQVANGSFEKNIDMNAHGIKNGSEIKESEGERAIIKKNDFVPFSRMLEFARAKKVIEVYNGTTKSVKEITPVKNITEASRENEKEVTVKKDDSIRKKGFIGKR